jgi:hypothetical protein
MVEINAGVDDRNDWGSSALVDIPGFGGIYISIAERVLACVVEIPLLRKAGVVGKKAQSKDIFWFRILDVWILSHSLQERGKIESGIYVNNKGVCQFLSSGLVSDVLVRLRALSLYISPEGE